MIPIISPKGTLGFKELMRSMQGLINLIVLGGDSIVTHTLPQTNMETHMAPF